MVVNDDWAMVNILQLKYCAFTIAHSQLTSPTQQ